MMLMSLTSQIEGDWKEIDLWHVVRALTSRTTARMVVGYPLCRDQKWLEASIKYTENALVTAFLLRLFPSSLHPLIYPFLPMAWKASWHLREARRIIVPMVEKRRSEKFDAPNHQKPHDFLGWMMDGAMNDDERDPAKLAHRELLVSQAAIHPTAMAATQALYDLCAYPEYHEILLEEIRAHTTSEGYLNQASLYQMQKLDSFMKESQRMSPPQLGKLGIP